MFFLSKPVSMLFRCCSLDAVMFSSDHVVVLSLECQYSIFCLSVCVFVCENSPELFLDLQYDELSPIVCPVVSS